VTAAHRPANGSRPRSREEWRHLFERTNAAAVADLPAILARWLPGGRVEGHRYSVRNPKRDDHRAGSFKINLHTGQWIDFASNDRGRDVASLAAYLFDISQGEAVVQLAGMLGVDRG
jgi:hypothetical protein